MWLCRYTRTFFINIFYLLFLLSIPLFALSEEWYTHANDPTDDSFSNLYNRLYPFDFREGNENPFIFCEYPHLGKIVDRSSLDFLFDNLDILKKDDYRDRGFFYNFIGKRTINSSPKITEIDFDKITDICFFGSIKQGSSKSDISRDALTWIFATRKKSSFGYTSGSVIYTIDLYLDNNEPFPGIQSTLFKAFKLAYELKKTEQFSYLVSGAKPSTYYVGYSNDLSANYLIFPVGSDVEEDSCIIFENGDSRCTWEKVISECEHEPLPDEPFSPNCRIVISDKAKGNIFEYVRSELKEIRIKTEEDKEHGNNNGNVSSGGSSSDNSSSDNSSSDNSSSDNSSSDNSSSDNSSSGGSLSGGSSSGGSLSGGSSSGGSSSGGSSSGGSSSGGSSSGGSSSGGSSSGGSSSGGSSSDGSSSDGSSSGGSSSDGSGEDDSYNLPCDDDLLSCISDLTVDVKDSLLALKQDLLKKVDTTKCSISSECPSIEISFWGETFNITIHCDIFSQTGETMSKGFQFLWVFVALLIVLSA